MKIDKKLNFVLEEPTFSFISPIEWDEFCSIFLIDEKNDEIKINISVIKDMINLHSNGKPKISIDDFIKQLEGSLIQFKGKQNFTAMNIFRGCLLLDEELTFYYNSDFMMIMEGYIESLEEWKI